MKKSTERTRTRKEDDYRMFCVWFRLAFKKDILSSVLKALALEVVTVGWLGQSSYIQGLEETMQNIYADQSVHCRSVNASLIFSVPFPLSATFCQLSLFSPTITCHLDMAGVRHGGGL